jgi:hypothetical protein
VCFEFCAIFRKQCTGDCAYEKQAGFVKTHISQINASADMQLKNSIPWKSFMFLLFVRKFVNFHATTSHVHATQSRFREAQ